jgi:hypothetical protein
VLFGISLVNKKAAYAAPFLMERAGIEPATSGLQRRLDTPLGKTGHNKTA